MPALLWSALIFILCFIPGSTLPKEDWLDQIHFDKIVHAGLYFVLFLLIGFASGKYRGNRAVLAAALCLAQGLLVEYLQGAIPALERSFDGWDILANILGVLLAIGVARWYTRWS